VLLFCLVLLLSCFVWDAEHWIGECPQSRALVTERLVCEATPIVLHHQHRTHWQNAQSEHELDIEKNMASRACAESVPDVSKFRGPGIIEEHATAHNLLDR
jgi:hypothetical protein